MRDMESEHSLRSVERREPNNPYPSMSMPRRASTVESSFVSRSDSALSRQTDDNASTKPIPPSHPASPAPSTVPSRPLSLLSPQPQKRHSASSASLSKSTSTRPTTISFDSEPPLGHIAQTPLASPSGAHPRANPHPQAPPDDNASTITLASSTLPMRKPALAPSPSVTWAPEPNDRASDHYPASGLSMRPKIADKDASVRAVRRRASWESDVSKWSWKPPDPTRDPIKA